MTLRKTADRADWEALGRRLAAAVERAPALEDWQLEIDLRNATRTDGIIVGIPTQAQAFRVREGHGDEYWAAIEAIAEAAESDDPT